MESAVPEPLGNPIFTVGHSDRPVDEFLRLVRSADVDLVADVRKIAGSRRNPQFHEDALRTVLGGAGIGYHRASVLGGRRPVSRDVSPAVNALWQNRSFHNYADYAGSNEFRAGLADLRRRARDRRVAVMCSEAVWWRCHRRIIADHLLAHGDTVFHIMAAGRHDPATLTIGAVLGPGARVFYPPDPAAT